MGVCSVSFFSLRSAMIAFTCSHSVGASLLRRLRPTSLVPRVRRAAAAGARLGRATPCPLRGGLLGPFLGALILMPICVAITSRVRAQFHQRVPGLTMQS